jgi:hypothetical protein
LLGKDKGEGELRRKKKSSQKKSKKKESKLISNNKIIELIRKQAWLIM